MNSTIIIIVLILSGIAAVLAIWGIILLISNVLKDKVKSEYKKILSEFDLNEMYKYNSITKDSYVNNTWNFGGVIYIPWDGIRPKFGYRININIDTLTNVNVRYMTPAELRNWLNTQTDIHIVETLVH